MRHIVSILLQNEAGALARVAGLFAARGYNIDSLTVAATHDAAVSRLTLVTRGDDAVIEQILQQSRKLIDVLDIADLTARDHLEVELVIAKLQVSPAVAPTLAACVRRHPRASIFDESATTRTVQFTGDGSEVSAFLSEVGTIAPVLELARSGTAALQRGSTILAVPA
jgi:acetolactate synthase-1/3 small subunit